MEEIIITKKYSNNKLLSGHSIYYTIQFLPVNTIYNLHISEEGLNRLIYSLKKNNIIKLSIN